MVSIDALLIVFLITFLVAAAVGLLNRKTARL